MKILLMCDHYNLVRGSGVGKALTHQQEALDSVGIAYTTDPKEDYDILHINTVFPASYLRAKKAKRLGKKVVYHAHSTREDFMNSFHGSNFFAPFFQRWITACYRTGDLILTPSEYSKKLIRSYGIGNTPIEVISNGIDLEKWYPDPDGGKRFRAAYDLKPDDKVIISVGLYIKRKGILDFVELAKRMPEYKFIWFGYTDLRYVPAEIGVAVNTKLDNLHFAGYVNSQELRDAYNGCDLYLFPTLEETEGIVLLEALACKTPSLIRDIPVFDDWAIDGLNIYKAKDLSSFQMKITDILEHQLPNLTEVGRKVAESRSISQIGHLLKQHYESLTK